jgi:hypothetical protein
MDWFGRERRRGPRAESALVEEADALVTGRMRGKDGAPAWVHLNWLAHGDPGCLALRCEVARRRRRRPERPGSWAHTRSEILVELVHRADGRSEAIAHLQRACLIPLELRLMEPPFGDRLPSEVLGLALTRLRSHPIVLDRGTAGPPDGRS